ncbi:MAG: SIS domain-containing protein, partial [Candidatus Omnitrophota bacterium]
MNILDDIQSIEKIDQACMRGVLDGFPQQCQQAFELAQGFSIAKDFKGVKNIVFCGMGGSAIGAELVSFYVRDEIKLPVTVNREYSLPAFVSENSLVIFSSYSGNTEETLSAYSDALSRKAKIIVLTSGGKLAESASGNGIDCFLVPQGFPPRGALGYLCLPLLSLLAKLQLIQDKEAEINETISLLERLKKESFHIEVKTEINPAKKLAQKLYDKFCVIYAGSEHLAGVVTRWRGQLAENS